MCELRNDVAWQKDLATGNRRQQAGDGWISTVPEPNDEVVDPSEPPACATCDFAAEDQREMKYTTGLHRRSHCRYLTAHIAKAYAARGIGPARRSGFVNRESRRAAE
jgi:hypothetical protein